MICIGAVLHIATNSFAIGAERADLAQVLVTVSRNRVWPYLDDGNATFRFHRGTSQCEVVVRLSIATKVIRLQKLMTPETTLCPIRALRSEQR